MSNKKYYWLRITESFYDSTIVRKIERSRNAAEAMYLYMRLLTRACKFNGELFGVQTGDALTAEDCGLLTALGEDQAAAAFDSIVKAGGIEDRSGVLFMPQAILLMGNETDAAARMRNMRETRRREREPGGKSGLETKEEENRAATGEDLTEADQDQEEDEQKTKRHEPETIAAEKQEEKPAKILNLKGKHKKLAANLEGSHDPIARIVAKLNEVTGKSFRATTKATRVHISARLAEGYTEEEFFKVIENRAAKWLNDPKMREYLRPETLFATKFEGYLQDANEASAGIWKPRAGDKIDLTEFDKFMAGGTGV